jgi:hypothetical protein
MHSCATVVIPLHDCVVFVDTLNRAELLCWFSEIAQTFNAVTGRHFRIGTWRPIEGWFLDAI